MTKTNFLRKSLASAVGGGITTFARILTGAQPRWIGCEPAPVPRIYFPNHASHADFILVWSSLPQRLRMHTRPVAGSDYWDKGGLRRFVIRDVFNAVLIDREVARASPTRLERCRRRLPKAVR